MGFLRRLLGLSKSVLVVDDEPVLVEAISLVLERRGFQVFKAKDGAEALSQALIRQPRLIILDIIMPGEKDGWKVLRALRASPATKSTPVVIMTTVNQIGDVNRSFELGANGYLVKPIDSLKLFQIVEDIIGKP